MDHMFSKKAHVYPGAWWENVSFLSANMFVAGFFLYFIQGRSWRADYKSSEVLSAQTFIIRLHPPLSTLNKYAPYVETNDI